MSLERYEIFAVEKKQVHNKVRVAQQQQQSDILSPHQGKKYKFLKQNENNWSCYVWNLFGILASRKLFHYFLCHCFLAKLQTSNSILHMCI